MKPRKNLWARVEALEGKIKPQEDDPTTIMIGDISLYEISQRLLEPEMEDFWESLKSLEEDETNDQAALVLETLLEMARERRDEGMIVIRQSRPLKEMYEEMKSRQQQGENIHYGDIDPWDVYLGREDSVAA